MQKLKQVLETATQDAQCWGSVCDVIAEVFGATGVILAPTIPQLRGQWMPCSRYLSTTLNEYITKGWHLKDAREKITPLMYKHGIATDDDLFPNRADKNKEPFYKEFLFPHNFGVLLGIRILTPNGIWGLMIHFANDHPPISDNERKIALQLQDLFQNATKKAHQNAHQSIVDFARFFTDTNSDIFVFEIDDTHYYCIDHNEKFISQDRLSTLIPENIMFSLDCELKSPEHTSVSRSYQLCHNGQVSNVLLIQPPGNSRHFFAPFKLCAIRTMADDITSIKQNILCQEYQLSEIEIETIELLSSGKSTTKIAHLLNLKASSIRQRLKMIYSKTNTQSQIELIAFYGRL